MDSGPLGLPAGLTKPILSSIYTRKIVRLILRIKKIFSEFISSTFLFTFSIACRI